MTCSVEFSPAESEIMIVLINQYLDEYFKYCSSWKYDVNRKIVDYFDDCLNLLADGYLKQIDVILEIDEKYEQDFNSISFIALNKKDMCSIDKKELYISCFHKSFKIFEHEKGIKNKI